MGVMFDAQIEAHYKEPHRYYHTMDHVNRMLSIFSTITKINGVSVTETERKLFESAIKAHDVIYDPRSQFNEEKSVDVVNEWFCGPDESKKFISDLIEATKISAYENRETLSDYQRMMQYIDCHDMYHSDLQAMIRNFHLLLKEFQFTSYPKFIEAHVNFINSFSPAENVREKYIAYVKSYRPKIGIYAGSFNPFHIGHLSVLEQSEKLFDKVIVAHPKITSTAYLPIEVLPFHEVVQFNGLLVDLIKKVQEYANVTLIRGLRNGDDLTYELNMKRVNCDLAGHICDTVYFVTDKPHISSTVVRSLMDLHDNSWIVYKPTKYDYAKVDV